MFLGTSRRVPATTAVAVAAVAVALVEDDATDVREEDAFFVIARHDAAEVQRRHLCVKNRLVTRWK